MTTVVITRSGTGWMLRSGYDPRIPPVCKEVGGRWSSEARAWRFSSLLQAQQVAGRLRFSGIDVVDEFPTTTTTRSTAVTLNVAFEQLFGVLPAPVREKTYKALVRALHPDAGGDLVTCQALTSAWERVAS